MLLTLEHQLKLALDAAKLAKHEAGYAMARAPSPANLARLQVAERTLRTARRHYAPYAREHQVATALVALRAIRYQYQRGRRSRTLDPGAALRSERRRLATRAAALATAKRVNKAF